MSMKKLLALLLCCVMVLSALAGCSEQEESQPTETQEVNRGDQGGDLKDALRPEQKLEKVVQRGDSSITEKKNTLMIYLVGSDLETKHAAASSDLVEMLESKLDISDTNVVVYAGGALAWHLPIPSECNTILEMAGEELEFRIVGSTKQPVNTGEAATLHDFLCYSYENYPAENYGLIMWDHGSGSVWGYGADEMFKGDGLFLIEMEEALAASPFAQKKLAFMGFDACLMATVETAATLAPYAEYMVASVELEDGNGWDYTCLNALNSGSFLDLANKVVSTYETSMKKLRTKPEYTLSLLDLSKIDGVLSAMDTLFLTAGQGVADGNFSDIAKARMATKTYGLNGKTDYSAAYDQVDLGHAAQNLSTLYSAEAKALTDAISKMVIKQVSNVKNVSGLSVYYPHYNTEFFFDQGAHQLYDRTTGSEGFKKFLDAYTDVLKDGKLDTQWVADVQPQQKPTHVALELTDEQLKNVGRVYYNVLQQYQEGSYLPVLVENLTEADNEILFPLDPEVVLVNSDIAPQPQLFLATQMSDTQFVSQYAVLMAGEDLLTGTIEPIHIALALNGNKLEIANIMSRDEEDGVSVRTSVSTEPWHRIAYYTFPVQPTEEGGQLLPLSQWERTNQFGLLGIAYDQEFWFETGKLSDLAGNYTLQIVVEDLTGKVIYNELIDMPATNVTTETVTTEKGEMTFNVYEDHAELAAYAGTDEALEIPAQVAGKPVTVIGKQAVQNISGLTQITLPNTVTILEERAFLNTPIETIVLSDKLTYIGDFALAGYAGTELNLPASVTHIGVKAFSGSKFQTVKLPSGFHGFQGKVLNM